MTGLEKVRGLVVAEQNTIKNDLEKLTATHHKAIDTGNLEEALKCYSKMQVFCTARTILDNILKHIDVYIKEEAK